MNSTSSFSSTPSTKQSSLYENYKNLLSQMIAFKSISTDMNYKNEMQRTADWLISLFDKAGFKTTVLEAENSNPVIVAEYDISGIAEKNPDAKTSAPQASQSKTILIYGHYDVQPAEQEEWKSQPFELTERDGRLYARGVVDNKGQILTHIAAVLDLIEQGELAYNIKFIIEGNEETSNPDLAIHLKENLDLLRADCVLISDGELFGEYPALEVALRGGSNIKITYKTAHTDLHSGIYGGAVPNAAHELAVFISKLYDPTGKYIAVPGFYEGVYDLATIPKLNADEVEETLCDIGKNIVDQAGCKTMLVHDDVPFHTQVGTRPTLQVSGFKSGYIGEGFANIVPFQAEARINIRSAAPQNTKRLMENLLAFIENETPSHVQLTIEETEIHDAIELKSDSGWARHAMQTLNQAYEKPVCIKRVGGSIPIVADMITELKTEVLLVPLGNEDCNMHGANENLRIDLAEKGLKWSRKFFSTAI